MIVSTLYCITCPSGCELSITGSGADMLVLGNKCKKGLEFAENETTNPTRTLTTTVRTKFPGVPVLSVRTDGEIPKSKMMNAMLELGQIVIEEELSCGDTVLEDVAETGVRVIVTSSALMQLGAELENKNVELGRSGSASRPIDDGLTEAGIGVVKVLDDIGAETAGGFVGAAGEAVGVEETWDEEDDFDDGVQAEVESGGRIKQKDRPHIKRE